VIVRVRSSQSYDFELSVKSIPIPGSPYASDLVDHSVMFQTAPWCSGIYFQKCH